MQKIRCLRRAVMRALRGPQACGTHPAQCGPAPIYFILNSLASGNYYTLDFEGGVSKFMGKCRLRKMLAAACETVGDEDVIVVGDWRFIDGEKGYIIMRML